MISRSRTHCGEPRHLETDLEGLTIGPDKDEENLWFGSFGLPSDERIRWGPNQDEIYEHLSILRLGIHRAAVALEPSLDMLNSAAVNTSNQDTRLLLHTALGPNTMSWPRIGNADPTPTQRGQRTQFLEAVLTASVQCWIIDSGTRCPENFADVLLHHYQQTVFDRRKFLQLTSLTYSTRH